MFAVIIGLLNWFCPSIMHIRTSDVSETSSYVLGVLKGVMFGNLKLTQTLVIYDLIDPAVAAEVVYIWSTVKYPVLLSLLEVREN